MESKNPFSTSFARLRVKLAHLTRDHRPHAPYANIAPASCDEAGSIVVLPWNTEEGKQRLLTSHYNTSFFHLAHTWQPQKNPFYCGVACIVTILNALRLEKGTIPSQRAIDYEYLDSETGQLNHYAYRAYSQLTLLDSETDTIKHRDAIAPKRYKRPKADQAFNPGLCLAEVHAILKLYNAHVEAYPALDDAHKGMTIFRDAVRRYTSTSTHFIMVNFYGKIKGLDLGGHFSVVGAYDEVSDSVLLLDVAGHKLPWYWVTLPHLYHAMNTQDNSGSKRGFLLVSDKL